MANEPNIAKSVISLPTAAAIIVALISIGGSIAGSYWASRAAFQMEMLQLKNDLRFEVSTLKNADEILNLRVSANTGNINKLFSITEALMPEQPRMKRFNSGSIR